MKVRSFEGSFEGSFVRSFEGLFEGSFVRSVEGSNVEVVVLFVRSLAWFGSVRSGPVRSGPVRFGLGGVGLLGCVRAS